MSERVRENTAAGASLNTAQQQAVDIIDGPVLVVAGAGTGKTRVIIERVMNLLGQGISPENILALTFTEKAAAEMLDRLNEARGSVTLDATVTTFNGFGNSLLEGYGVEWGLGRIRLMGEVGQLVFLREHLDEFELDYFAPISSPDSQLGLLAEYVSLLKQQLVNPEEYTAYAKKLPASSTEEQFEKRKHQELARFYDTYLKLCRTHQVIDYDDQLYLAIELLRARPNILHELQTRYQYILVDEFQDTNPMQSALIDLLAGKHQNIMVVGDDDQSIYGWRGATLANILDFKKTYPKAREITLIENYRSTQAILDAAHGMIQHNNPDRLEVMNNLDKRLCAQTNDGPPPRALHFTNLDAELTWIAEDIAKRLERGEDPAGIAVLARRNSGVQKMHEALESKGIAHAVTGLGNDIYEQPAVRQLIEALKAVNDPLDDVALFHTLSGPLFSIEATQLALLAAAARREHLPLRDMVHNTENERANAALGQLEIWRSQSAEQTVGSLAYAMITDSGWKHTLSSEADSDTELLTQVQALSKFFKTLKEFERISGVGSLQSYIANLPTLRTSGTSFEDVSLDISPTQVNVLSVHRAKGLEWDTVYIIDCTEGSFPLRVFGSNLAIPDTLRTSHTLADEHMAEERRLMYVAVTRARHELILTHANQHGSGSRRAPSRFLHELLGEYTGDAAQTQQDSTEQLNLELFAPRTARDSDAPTIQLPPDMAQDGHFILSVSQIACWLRCPKDFYYTYVLQVPLPPNPALQYGTAIHGAIEAIHTGRREGTPPTLQQLLEQVETALPTAGYLSKRSRERAHDRARQTVEAIYERFSSAPLPIKVETSFSIAMPDMPLKIIGRMDAVYALENGVEIRDFKTGTSVTTPDKAKQRATGSNQLTLYALAWQLMHDEMPALLTLDFVETGQIGTVRKQPKSLATLSAKLQDMVAHLQAGEYPEGKDHTFCHHEQ